MTLTDLFDRTFVLNLPHRADRRREMGTILRQAGMDWKPGRLELFEASKVEDAAGFPGLGARGCFLSHLRMLRRASELGVRRLLIMEDDLDLDLRIAAAVPALASRLSGDDWDLAYLGHQLPEQDHEASALGHLVEAATDLEIRTTHFYAVHGQVLDRLIGFLDAVLTRPPGHPDGGPMHVDGALTMFRRRNLDVRTLLAQPNLGWQRASSSDITTNWVDQNPLLRHVARAARVVKRRLRR